LPDLIEASTISQVTVHPIKTNLTLYYAASISPKSTPDRHQQLSDISWEYFHIFMAAELNDESLCGGSLLVSKMWFVCCHKKQ
jgi:hypothetical protein